MNRNVMEQFIAHAHKTMDEHGRAILYECSAGLLDILPVKVAETVKKCITGLCVDEKWKWISARGLGPDRVGIQLVSTARKDKIELLKFKRVSVRALLSNLGFVVMDGGTEVELSSL